MKIGVIADDLTGANATGVRLSKQGFQTASMVFGLSNPEGRYDAICVDTDSRYVSPDEAKRRVTRAATFLRECGVELFCKRIDSTFRGNVGVEIDALLDVLGSDVTAVVVPAFPDSGRITVGGYLLVNGVPLSRTDVAKDPISPIRHSHVPRLLRESSKHRIASIGMDTVLQGEGEIRAELEKLARAGNRIIVTDAGTEEQVESIARAMDAVNLPLIAVDPGPLTVAFAKTKSRTRRAGSKVLVTVGSVTPTTGRQLDHLIRKWDCEPVFVPPESLAIGSEQRDQAMEWAISTALEKVRDSRVILVTTYHPEQGILDIASMAEKEGISESSLTKSISDGLAGITRRIIERSEGEIGGCFSSGGDVTASLFAVTGASGIELIEEVQPLIAYGRFIGGYLDRFPLVTKGGMVGDDGAISHCVRFLMSQLSKNRDNRGVYQR